MTASMIGGSDISLVHRQNLKLAWYDDWRLLTQLQVCGGLYMYEMLKLTSLRVVTTRLYVYNRHDW